MTMGLILGESAEAWNLSQPHLIRQVHCAYIEAGAQLVLTNTLGANKLRLAPYQLTHQVIEINQQAVRLARANATSDICVAGAIGIGVDAEQVQALVSAGVDLLWLETMVDWEEMKTAVSLIRSLTNLPLAVTMSFHGQVSPAQFAKFGQDTGLWACGANCGEGFSQMERIITEMHTTAPQLPLIAKSNAGLPDKSGNYAITIEQVTEHAKRVKQAGATLIGGCCGIHPPQIQAMHKTVMQ